MTNTILVCGYGPGISNAVARKFGAEGFSVALAGRNSERLSAAVTALKEHNIKSVAFPTDLSNPVAVRELIANVRKHMGTITILHWNPMALSAGDLMTADVGDLRSVFDTNITGLVAAVQSALPDLKAQATSAVLVTNGGAALDNPEIDRMAASYNFMGLAVAKAAQHKLVSVLAEKLRNDGIYVGEVVVMAAVKGTVFDTGSATLEADLVADKFWQLFRERTQHSVLFPS